MDILTDIISTLDLDAEVRDIRQGIFHTGVLIRRCGLAATLPKDALKQTPPMVKEPGRQPQPVFRTNVLRDLPPNKRLSQLVNHILGRYVVRHGNV